MTLIEEYETYRNIGRDLHSKIMNTCRDRDAIMKSARLLGIAQGDHLVFESENDTNNLMDFVFHEYKVNGKNFIKIYQEKVGGKNNIEKDLLNALLSSYTSLFKVVSISEPENILILNDVLNKKDNIKLMDIAFSQTGAPGLLLFIRLVPFKEDINITSGVSFAFPGESQRNLIKRYEKLSREVKSDNDSIKRFVSFYELSKTYGIEVSYF